MRTKAEMKAEEIRQQELRREAYRNIRGYAEAVVAEGGEAPKNLPGHAPRPDHPMAASGHCPCGDCGLYRSSLRDFKKSAARRTHSLKMRTDPAYAARENEKIWAASQAREAAESRDEKAYEQDCATLSLAVEAVNKRLPEVLRGYASDRSEAVYFPRPGRQPLRVAAHLTVMDGRREYDDQILLGADTSTGRYKSNRLSAYQVFAQVARALRLVKQRKDNE